VLVLDHRGYAFGNLMERQDRGFLLDVIDTLVDCALGWRLIDGDIKSALMRGVNPRGEIITGGPKPVLWSAMR
jgi:hypothetical protein